MALKRQDLADALGVTPQQVWRLSRRGMPLSSVRAAREWRAANLDPSQAREFRVDTRRRAQPSKPAAPALASETFYATTIALVERLADRASREPEGPATDDFRCALRGLPLPLRARLRLPQALLERLVMPALEALGIAPDPDAAEAQSDADADLVGALLLALVAGDLEARPDAGLVYRTAAGGAVLAALTEGGA